MIKLMCIKLINLYQKFISPVLKSKGCKCKYYPTCSEYTKQSIQRHGVIKGIFFGIKRILKCNPLSKGGYDPVK